MSNPITDARAEVTTALTGLGIRTFAFIPSKLDGVAAILLPGDPYVLPGQVMGELRVALLIRLMVPQKTESEVVSEALDEMIVNVCAALRKYGMASVKMPGIDSESYAKPYLATDITITINY